MNRDRFNVPSYMGQQPQRSYFPSQGGGCGVGHFNPSQSTGAFRPAMSTPQNNAMPIEAPKSTISTSSDTSGYSASSESTSVSSNGLTDSNPCHSKPGTVVTGAATGLVTGAMTGSRAGPWGTIAGMFYGVTSGAAGGMLKDSYDIQECLDKKAKSNGPKP
jgi:hypothetical protein